MAKITVLNPVAQTVAASFPTAPRTVPMNGSKLGLWWNEKPGGEIALEHAGTLLTKSYGTSLVRQFQGYPAAASAIDNIVRNADIVIGATGD